MSAPADVEELSAYGDRLEIRRLWAKAVTPESIGFCAATQVYVVEREVIPKSPVVEATVEKSYGICSLPSLPDQQANAGELLAGYCGHWSVESKNHYRRDVSYHEDRSPVKHHNAARVLATMKMLAIFLCELGAHRPLNDRERTLPEFNRSCAINGVDRAINWIKRKHNPLGR